MSVACALLAGCGDAPATLDAQVAAAARDDDIDPVVMEALNEPIMIDPMLTAQADSDSVRPPPRPYSGALPPDGIASGSNLPAGEKLLSTPAPTERRNPAARESITLEALAARRFGPDCAARLRYSAAWANRLPTALPLHPDARVIEAAGVQGDGCSLRAVGFYAAQPIQAMLDWHYTRARRAGYSATHEVDEGVHMLAGARGSAGYALYLTDRGDGGTDVEMIVRDGGA
ncbi:hypothetical protein OKW76_07335 [Sphingomonas sp. S1-29]|uniref:hypothetical protein n=1 Tax=Sphingomonas sp. S1-29 TaxID=2991074 RepID=UPI00223F7C20|nr:hypothetical protein [Sphingomonas sp. S1-29]UZK70826.1 hypothetical protein OKW76_07335 [Sphingomonas sp. S1-29]